VTAATLDLATQATPAKIRVCINDDQTLFREAVSRMLAAQPAFEVVGEGRDGEEAVRQAVKLRPDVILMDIGMPVVDGLEATRQLKAALPGVRVVALTVHASEEVFRRAMAAGVDSFVLKDAKLEDLIATIRLTYAGNRLFNGTLLKSFVERRREATPSDRLTPREMQVLRLVAGGLTNRVLASTLHMSEKTARNHISNIYTKLGVAGRAQAVLWALRNGLVGEANLAGDGSQGG
jgi:DNA-binding NarL/FixJ family response regulator